MTIKYELYNGQRTYMFPTGEIATPEILETNYPAITVFPHIIQVNGDVCEAVMNVSALRQMYNIDETLTVEEAVIALENIANTPPPNEPTLEERQVAALELQNLLNM